MKPKILIPIAQGTEELEAVSLSDTLVRAGAEVVFASVEDQLQVSASRGLILTANRLITDALTTTTWDLILLPGGTEGAQRLGESAPLIQLLKQQFEAGRKVGAICADPALVLSKNGFLEGHQATCYPSFASQIDKAVYVDAKIVISGNLFTSQGPATALPFALELVNQLFGADKRQEVAAGMLVED